jgi:phage-related protein (TIGR01555 family)
MHANDGLQSLIGNLGELSRDKNAGTYYGMPYIADQQLSAAYRSSWLARKIVDIPARDSVRAGINWMAEKADIERIEAEANRLNLLQKIYRARVLGRLYGGGALFIGTDQDAKTPLNLEGIRAGGLKYLVVHSRLTLHPTEFNWDPLSENYGKPAMYRTYNTDIHPSRLVLFYGAEIPEGTPLLPGLVQGWSDSSLLPVWDAVRNADVAPQLVTSLLHEANVDHFGITEFMASLSNPGYEQLMLKRFSLIAANKGINGTVLHDKDEEYERSSVSFASIPDVIDKLMVIVSGAADIPATRLFGQSPAGMSSTGDSDLRNYYDRLSGDQRLDMTPAVYNLTECLIRSGTGAREPSTWFQWSPLWQMSAAELAEIGKKNAETANTLNNTGLISSEALSTVVVNQMVESGFYPGLEEANAEAPIDFEVEAVAAEEQAKALAANPQAVGDATRPRTLYMRRHVKNAAAIVAWAKNAGFKNVMPADMMHVTIAYSKTPLDWMLVGAPWDAELTIVAGGPRTIEQFDGGAIVLAFSDDNLQYRHQKVMNAGGSSTYDDYQPHITISWLEGGIDLSTVEPYTGEIVLGPELFSEIDESWRAKI